jgi:hypothetical protein
VRWRYCDAVTDRQPAQTLRYELPAGNAKHVLVTRLQPWDTLHETRVTCPCGACEIALTTDVPDRVGIVKF